MSKDQKPTVIIPVETVDNWNKTLAYMMTSLDFWIDKIEDKWPLNLIYDGLNELSNNMFEITQSVSRGNINDK